MKAQQNDSFDIMKYFNWENHIQDQQQRAQNTSGERPENSSKPKRVSFKNKYVNKVKQSCGGISTSVRPHTQPEIELNLDSEAEKKLKNKQAARQSRQRKKQYINIVQKEIRMLQQELLQVSKDLQVCKGEIEKANQISEQNIAGSVHAQSAQVYKKLRKFVREEDSIDLNADINLAVDSLCYRFALLGMERLSNIDRGYREIFKLGFPPIHRYLTWCAKQSCHIFSDENVKPEHEQWFAEIQPIIGDWIHEHKQKLMGKREGLATLQATLEELFKRFLNKRQDIILHCGEIDELHQQIRNIYTPKQLAKFLILCEGINYKSQLSFFEKICNEGQEQLKKKIKVNQQ